MEWVGAGEVPVEVSAGLSAWIGCDQSPNRHPHRVGVSEEGPTQCGGAWSVHSTPAGGDELHILPGMAVTLVSEKTA